MRVAEFAMAVGGTLIVLFLALFLSRRDVPVTHYEASWEELTLRHEHRAIVRGGEAPARFDVTVDGGLLPDSSVLAVYLRPYFHGAVGDRAEYKSVPLLTVAGEGLLYRRELVNQGVGKEFEYYLRLSATLDSITVDSTLATIPSEHRLDPAKTLKVRFEGAPNKALLVAHIVLMYLGLLAAFLAVFAGYDSRPGAKRQERIGRFVLLILLLLVIGVFALGTQIERQTYGTWWSGIPVSTNLTDTFSLVLCLYWILAMIGLKGSAWSGESAQDLVNLPTARVIAVVGLILMVIFYLVPHGSGRM